MTAKALPAPHTFGQKLARRLHAIVDAVLGGDLPDDPPTLGQVFGRERAQEAIDPEEAQRARASYQAQEKERREMAVIHETRYILQAQAGVQGNYLSVADLARHFKQRQGIDRVELERILAFRGEPYFERVVDRLYLRGHVNG